MLPIDALTLALQQEFGLVPVLGAEIECYVQLVYDSPEAMDAFWAPLDRQFKQEQLSVIRIEKERGSHQFEVITGVATAAATAASLARIRQLIEQRAAAQNVAVTFAAKPYPDQPSSGMHIHLHLGDGEGINAYHKTDEWMSRALEYSLGGLVAALNDSLEVFFPNPEDYARLDDADHVPKIAGWGVNNRYCALRIPMTPDPYDKRIEHRVPCANANPVRVVEVILEAVLKGLREQITPPEQSYGRRAALV